MKRKTILNKYLNKLDIHTLEVVKKSSATVVVRILGMFATLVISIILGRTIGAEGLGVVNLATQIVGLLPILIMFGFTNVLIKNISIAYDKRDWQDILDNVFTSQIFNGTIALIVTIAGIVFASFISKNIFHDARLSIPLIILISIVIPQTFSRIFAAGLNGFRKIWQSQLVDGTLSNWIVALILIVIFLSKIKIDPIRVALVYAIGRIIVTITVSIYWKRTFTYKGRGKVILKKMLKVAPSMMIVHALGVLAFSTDTVMLGWLADMREVGIYNVAARIAGLTIFFLSVSNSVITPKIASLFSQGNFNELEKMVKRVTRILMILGTVTVLIFIIAGQFILSLWGNDFNESYYILITLGVGQLINLATGSVGQILIMCGHERTYGKLTFIMLLLNITLNYILIPIYSSMGAAIATAFGLAFLNITSLIIVNKKLNISTISFKRRI